MDVSPVRPTATSTTSDYAAALRISLAAKAQSRGTAAGPTDADGDHDGTRTAKLLDVEA